MNRREHRLGLVQKRRPGIRSTRAHDEMLLPQHEEDEPVEGAPPVVGLLAPSYGTVLLVALGHHDHVDRVTGCDPRNESRDQTVCFVIRERAAVSFVDRHMNCPRVAFAEQLVLEIRCAGGRPPVGYRHREHAWTLENWHRCTLPREAPLVTSGRSSRVERCLLTPAEDVATPSSLGAHDLRT